MNVGILAAIVSAFLGSFIPLLMRKQGEVPEERAGYQILMLAASVAFAALTLLWASWKPGDGLFLGCSIVGGIGLLLNVVGLYYATRMGPLAIAWIVAYLASPATALLWLLYPGTERWTWLHALGTCFFLGSLFFMWRAAVGSRHGRNILPVPVKKGFFTVVIVSLAGGILMMYASKTAFSHPSIEPGSVFIFLVVSQVVTLAGACVFYFINTPRIIFTRRHFRYAGLAGLVETLVLLLLLWGVDKAEVVRFFTANAATAIICTVLMSWRFENEKPVYATVVGAVLAAAAISCVAGR